MTVNTLTLKILAEKSNIGHRYNSELNGIHMWGPCVTFWTAFPALFMGCLQGAPGRLQHETSVPGVFSSVHVVTEANAP